MQTTNDPWNLFLRSMTYQHLKRLGILRSTSKNTAKRPLLRKKRSMEESMGAPRVFEFSSFCHCPDHPEGIPRLTQQRWNWRILPQLKERLLRDEAVCFCFQCGHFWTLTMKEKADILRSLDRQGIV
jgi:hypothetical protein